MGDSREALILEMRAENELAPEVSKAVQQLERFELSAEESAAIMDKAMAKAQTRVGAFADAATAAATQIEGQWKQTVKSVDQLAGQIAKSGSSTGTISLDVAGANAQAQAARDKLTALQLIETAQVRSAAAEGKMTVATEQYVSAVRQAIAVQQGEVASLTAQAGALERMEIELRQAGVATAAFDAQQSKSTTVSGQHRAAMQQLSFQLNDVAIGFAAGTPPMVIFAQQSSQVIQAVQMMSTGTKGFLGFLGGPWGIGLTAAAVMLTPFISKLMETGDAADRAKEKVYGLRDALADLRTKPMEALGNLNVNVLNAEGKLRNAQNMPRFTGGGSEEYKKGTFVERQRAKAIADAQAEVDGARSALAVAKSVVESNKSLFQIVTKAGRLRAKSLDDDDDDKKRGRNGRTGAKGPSAETLAKREEAARLQILDRDTAYSEQERQARHKLLEATRKTAASEAERDALLREDINAEAAAQATKIQNQLSSKDISEKQAEHLLDLNERNRAQRLQNLFIERASQAIRDKADLQAESLDEQIAMLRIEADMESTAKGRRDIERRILDLQKQREKLLLEAVIEDQRASEADKTKARGKLGTLDARYAAEGQQNDTRNAGPLEQYRQRLEDAVGGTNELNESFERVQAQGLQSFEDGLVGIVSGTKSVSDAFSSMADQIIADLMRMAVQKLIVDQLLGALGGALGLGGGSGFGSASQINSSTLDSLHSTPLPAFAGGGRITGAGTGTSDSIALWGSHGEFMVNARSTAQYLPLLEAINSGRMPKFASGGPISPRLPSVMRDGRSGGPSGSGQTLFDLRGAVMTADLVAQMDDIASRRSDFAVLRDRTRQIRKKQRSLVKS